MARKSRSRKSQEQVELDVKEGHYNIRKLIKFKNMAQKQAYDQISDNRIAFLCGCAGTAKTFLSVVHALDEYYKGNVSKIILTRPMIEAAGEKMGFLPGALEDKIHPYLIPLFDLILNFIESHELECHLAQKTIEISPLAFMRGRTFNDAFVVCDEAQNMNFDQIKMLLSRIGENSKIVLAGDSMQSDLKKNSCCFDDVAKSLSDLDFVGFFQFNEEHIVRDPIIAKVLEKLEECKNGWE